MNEGEINEKIAVEVMGWRAHETNGSAQAFIADTGDGAGFFFEPSRRISDAWCVVEKMREKGWLLTLYQRGSKDLFSVQFDGDGARTEQLSGTAPMAICLAALAAVDE